MGKSLDEVRALYRANEVDARARREAAAALRARITALESLAMAGRCPVCEEVAHFTFGSAACAFRPTAAFTNEADVHRAARRLAIEAADFIDAPPGTRAHRKKGPSKDPAQDAIVSGRASLVGGMCGACGAVGGHAAGCPEETREEARERRREAAKEVIARSGGRFTKSEHPSSGRPDAILHFGRFAGRAVSDIMLSSDGAGYLRWVLREEFSEDLKIIIRMYV